MDLIRLLFRTNDMVRFVCFFFILFNCFQFAMALYYHMYFHAMVNVVCHRHSFDQAGQ